MAFQNRWFAPVVTEILYETVHQLISSGCFRCLKGKIKSVEFLHNAELMLVAGMDSKLRLFQVNILFSYE